MKHSGWTEKYCWIPGHIQMKKKKILFGLKYSESDIGNK